MDSIPQVHQQAGGRCASSRPTLVNSLCATQQLIQLYFSAFLSTFLSVLLCDHLHVCGREHTRGADQEGATPVDAGRSSVVCLCCCTGTTSPVATTGESRDRHWRSPDTRSTLVCGALKIAFKGFSSEKGDMRVKELGENSENSWLAEHEILW